jgi:hypothetical protein
MISTRFLMKQEEINVKQITLIMLLILSVAFLSATLMWDNAVAIRQGVNIEWFRTGTETADGGAIYVWSDTKLGERDLWAQKVDANGNMVWGDPLLIDGKPDRQEDPVITRTSDGNYIIAWIDFFDDLDGNVYAQKINDNGQLLWPEGGKPVCTLPGIQIGLNMEADMDGGAFIIWGDSRNPSKDLYAQRVSSTGDPLWTLNGIPVADGPGDEVQNTMLPDGQGGMMLAYTYAYVGDSDVYAKHFDADGNMTWGDTLGMAVATGNQSGVRMAALTGGEFMFTWTDQRNDDPDIYAQKLNIAGDLLWPDPFIVYGDQDAPTPAPQKNPRIQATSDNAAVIVWEDFRLDNQNADLFAQKLAADGAKLWDDDGIELVTAEFAQIGQRMASDNAGGVYVVWDDLRNGNSPNDDVYAQHLDTNGQALWTADGKAIASVPNEQNGGLVKVAGSNVFINWMDLRNGSVGLYYQVLDASGNEQLSLNGEEIFWGLSGDTPIGQYTLLPRSDDTVIIWQDTRFANEGARIYFQFLDADGQTLLETNGRPLTMQGSGRQEQPQAVVTDDDHIAIVWVDGRGNNPNIYAQLISPSGDRLWGDNGIKLTDAEPLKQQNPMISYHNDSFYIGWSGWDLVDGSHFFHVYGQRIFDGEKLWGPDGIMVSYLEPEEMNNECTLSRIEEDYYVWTRISPLSGAHTIWAKRVNENGTAAPGWDQEGLQATEVSGFTIQILPEVSSTPQGIYVTWKDMRMWPFRYYAQHISANGERLWDTDGVSVADNGVEQEFASVTVTDHGIITAWCENINGMHDIKIQKFSFPGAHLYGELGYNAVQKDSTQSHPTLVSFADNGMMLAWADYFTVNSDIYYNYINNNGELIFGTQGAILTDAGKAQYEPKATVLNDNAYLIWADGRSSGKTEILGIYAQKVNNETVSTEDQLAPQLHSAKLKQNYPNPFNPNTTIALDLPQKAELEVNIYNAKGQLVKRLFGGVLEKGEHSFSWNGKDDNGNDVASGIYFYSAQQGDTRQSRKMLLMK